jgi:hypothetical protein
LVVPRHAEAEGLDALVGKATGLDNTSASARCDYINEREPAMSNSTTHADCMAAA